ncbi:MAG: type II toxin-antitoxin system VapC family toxin [bacterium]
MIDASVLIKFYVPEILSDRAERLLAKVEREEIGLLAPDLIYPEAGNTLWKKQRLKELTRFEVEEITDAILSLPLKIESSKPLISLAVELATVYGITVCDALYISLTKVYETTWITADRKLAEGLGKTDLRDSVTWLGSYK